MRSSLFLIQHRGAPGADATLENTPDGALASLQAPHADGLELDVSWDGRVWLTGHEAGRGATLDDWLAVVAETLVASGRLLLLDIKRSRLDVTSAHVLASGLARAGVTHLRASGFNELGEIAVVAQAGLPVALFVQRTASPARLSPEQGFAFFDRHVAHHGLDACLILRWAKGAPSGAELVTLERACQARTHAGSRLQLWFSGIGHADGFDERIELLVRAKREAASAEVVTFICDHPERMREYARAL